LVYQHQQFVPLPASLTLSLFMLRVFADNPENALSFNNLALITSFLYRRFYLHNLPPT
jgi:hypothetical protein